MTVVNVKSRTGSLQTRKKPPIIYHKLSVPRPYSALKIQMMVDSRQTSTMVILLRHEKLPTKKACDVIKVVRNITKLEGNHYHRNAGVLRQGMFSSRGVLCA